MKTLNSLFAVSLILAAFGIANIRADSKLVTPHQKDAPQTVPAQASADFAHAQTALGNAAQSKAAGPVHVAASTTADPNLLACKQLGKASCPKGGTAVPCCSGPSVMPCCK